MRWRRGAFLPCPARNNLPEKVFFLRAPFMQFVRLMILAAMVFAPSAFAKEALILDVPQTGEVPVEINGHALRFRLHGDGPSAPVLDSDTAQRLGLKGGLVGVATRFGSQVLRGDTAVARYSVAGMPDRRRVMWFPLTPIAGFAGEMGPGAVPHPQVRYRLHPAKVGEREFIVPLNAVFRAGMGTQVGDVFVRFDPLLATSYATANAGAAIHAEYGGAFAGGVSQREIHFGIVRPIRKLELGTPFRVGPVTLAGFDVRTTDHGSVDGIPDASADFSEIVVTAKKGGKPNLLLTVLNIGRDGFGHCSSVVFDKPRKVVRFTCPV